ncbi:putative ATPase [Kibdelosporangium banguiense]|uniref:ATPase n=1 Tax=Kibdelosporangium banguiense TaxID=1365924 RepID=A0ABS4TX50_9PSEU|nr:AAA family ATPase [Kibdelosporangium banguiense]MBP2328569.1 putative ATPase [Kibdelosporangium banguiense]
MTPTSSRRPKNNLPAEVTSFVDRRREVAETKRVLRRRRLLTVTGVAGVGKTRLVLRAAAQLREEFPDGIWLVELAGLTDDKLLPQTVADVLGLQDQSARSTVDILFDYLRDKQLLLVLDNCEHLVDTSAILADALLGAAPELRILATSRQALGTTGEYLLEVPPLPVPDLRHVTSSSTPYAAVRLFAERAATAMPGFRVDATNHEVVAQICDRLDGIPLAIELAAVRVRAMSIRQMLARLGDYFEFLAGGSRVSAPRVQTLRRAIDWSFDLCSASERALWVRACVFADGFDLDAAEVICSCQEVARETVLDLVAGLVDKSVLIRMDHGDPARYRMPEPIRQYGEERLAPSGLRTALRARHRNHYRHLIENATREWLGPNEVEWLVRLQREHANIRAALEFCLTTPGEAQAGLEIAAAPWTYLILTGSHREGRHWLDQALELSQEPSSARANALWTGGWIALQQADVAAGQSMVEESRALAQRLHDESAFAHATRISGMAAFYQNDLQRAVTLLEDALTHHHAAGDLAGVWIALLQLTVATAVADDPERAVAFGEECLALSETRAHLSRSWALWSLGFVKWLTGDRQQAGKLIRESLRLGRFHNQWGIAHSLEILAWIAAAEGDDEHAARLLGTARKVWKSVGTPMAGLTHLAPSHAQCVKRARRALGNEKFAAAFHKGTRLTLDEVIEATT